MNSKLVIKSDFFISCSFLLLCVLFLNSYINLFATSRIYDVLQISCVLSFFAGVLLSSKNKVFKTFLLILGILIFNFVYYYCFFRTSSFLEKYYLLFLSFMPLPLSFYCIDLPAKRKKSLLLACLLMVTITVITTSIGINQHPYASKMMANSGLSHESLRQYYKLNIGGYQFVYMVVCCSPVFIYTLFNQRRKIISIAFLVLLTVMLIKSQYATAVLLFILLAAIELMIMSGRMSGKQSALYFVLLIVSFFVIIVVFTMASDSLIAFFKSLPREMNVLAERMISFVEFFNGGDQVGDATFRLRLYTDSIMAFFDSAFLGSAIAGSKYTVWGHSGLFDLLGKGGILGGALLFLLFYIYYKGLKLKTHYGENETLYRTVILCSISFFILGCVNPAFGFPAISMGAFLVPTLIE